MSGDASSSLVDPGWNVTNATSGDTSHGQVDNDDQQFVYICSALFSFCYILAGVVCCRCYWLHLRKKLEGNRNTEGALKTPVARKDEAKDVPDLVDLPVEEDNEFLEAKCC